MWTFQIGEVFGAYPGTLVYQNPVVYVLREESLCQQSREYECGLAVQLNAAASDAEKTVRPSKNATWKQRVCVRRFSLSCGRPYIKD